MSIQPVGQPESETNALASNQRIEQMPTTDQEKSVTVKNTEGLHARPADQFVRLAMQFDSEITVCKHGVDAVDGKSILSILTLCATRGTELVIRAQGDDAEDAVCQLSKLVELGFDE
jgi:phosphotransferase system HPr (HPr) family protein|tara:strand:+ start:37 stop:387 length:351 start_codon:yes stop_codon:yes gene_type:complete